MTSIRRAPRRVTLGLCAAWMICGGCNDTRARRDTGAISDTGVAPTPPAATAPQVTGCPKDNPPLTPDELKACLATLQFDIDTLAGDEQPLTVIGASTGLPCPGDAARKCRFGPLAKIEPVIGAQNYSESDLKLGRIIARISVDGSQTEGYKKYGLQPGGTTYWWVKTDATGRGGRSVFVTQTRDGKIVLPPVERVLERQPYEKGKEPTRALARWVWTLKDETAKGTCGAAKC
jgi:hypothetical protein